MDPIVEAGLISGVGSLLSGIFGGASSNYSADMAYKMNKETNEQNYKIWQEQQQHNIDMFNMENQANIDNWKMQFDAQNAYNSPIEQVRRLREAGLNPALASSNQASTSAISSASAHPAGAPTMQMPDPAAYQSPLGGFANGMLQGLSTFANTLNTIADAGGKNAKLPFEVEGLRLGNTLLGLQGDKTSKEISKLGLEFDALNTDLSFQKDTYDLRVKMLKQQSDIFDATITQMNLSNRAQEIMNEWLPVEKQLQMITGIQNLENMKLQGMLTEEECRNRQVERIKMYAETKKIDAETQKIGAETNEINANIGFIEEQTKSVQISNKEAEALVDEVIATQKMSMMYDRLNIDFRDDALNPKNEDYKDLQEQYRIGLGMRELLGGWLPFSANYSIPNGSSPKPMRRIGF